MKTEKQKANQGSEEKRFPLTDGWYMKKMEDGYYKAFREDDTEVTGVNLPINICLKALRGELPGFVTVYPSDLDIAMEPELEKLRNR